jgi:hypothetical protein
MVDELMSDTLDALKKVRAELEGSGLSSGDGGKAGEEVIEETGTQDNTGDGQIDNTGITHGIIVNVNGEDVKLTGKSDYIYVDVFEFIDFDLSKPQGRAVVTMLNDRKAIFNEPIKSGDKIEIRWE